MQLNQLKSDLTHYAFPMTHKFASRRTRNSAATIGKKYGAVAGALVADTLLLAPRVVFGKNTTVYPQDALRPRALSIPDRGLVGCVSFGAGKLLQYACAGAGALIGVLASGAGALVGRGGRHWVDLAAGKGWQIGTAVGSCAMMLPTALARCIIRPVSAVLLAAVDTLGDIGHVLGQLVDAARNAPLYSQTA